MVTKPKTQIVTLKFNETQNIEKINNMVSKTENTSGLQTVNKVRKQEATPSSIPQKSSSAAAGKSSASSTPAPSKQQSAASSSSNSVAGNPLITSSKGLPMNQATTGNGISSLDRSGKRVLHWTKQPRVVKSFTGYSMVFGSWISKARDPKKTAKSAIKDGAKIVKSQTASVNGAATKSVDPEANSNVKLETSKDSQTSGSATKESKILVSAN